MSHSMHHRTARYPRDHLLSSPRCSTLVLHGSEVAAQKRFLCGMLVSTESAKIKNQHTIPQMATVLRQRVPSMLLHSTSISGSPTKLVSVMHVADTTTSYCSHDCHHTQVLTCHWSQDRQVRIERPIARASLHSRYNCIASSASWQRKSQISNTCR